MIRRSLNWKVLLITFVVGSITAATLFAVHSWQLSRTATGLLALADVQEQQSDWQKAAEIILAQGRLSEVL